MKTKSMQAFRRSLKNNTTGLNLNSWDENFIGYEKDDKSGLFKLLHGKKPDIAGLLAMPTEMAEDGQAVYEFIQNAADSESSHFYMFYNEEYLLTINNGKVFDDGGITSIINIGQSYDKKHDPDKIGRFGIGFKLVHRLVGTTSGLDEIIKEYKGPQLFSWSKKTDFEAFVNSTEFAEDDTNSDTPWLMKILMTCFPATVNETVKDLEYNDFVPYTMEEVNDFQQSLRKNFASIDNEVMDQGTMIFIKLGEGKRDLLNKNQDDINNRLENTLYFLKDLKHIQVNDKKINRQPNFVLEERFIIQPEENDFKKIGLTDERDSRFPIILQFGYDKYVNGNTRIGNYPNFYKYFPMEDTIYGLQFIFHSNVFSIGSNRRHIHDDSVNRGLLNLLGHKIAQRLEERKSSSYFYDIFANTLLSDCNSSTVSEHLMFLLYDYLSKNTPTSNGQYLEKSNVIIKGTALECEPSDFGISKEWFKWNALNEDDKELIKQSKTSTKLGLIEFSLKKLLEEGDITSINKWISKLDDPSFNDFLVELNGNLPSNLNDIEFIQMDGGRYLSIKKLDFSTIIKFPKISSITDVLNSLGLILSKTDFDEFEFLKNKISESHTYLKQDTESKLYENFLCKILPLNKLTSIEKKKLFLTLGTFKNIAEKTLSNELLLFCNSQGDITPLSKMVSPLMDGIEPWLMKFSIKAEEIFDEITTIDYLRKEQTVFNDIIVPNWSGITNSLTSKDVPAFLQSAVKYSGLSDAPMSIKSKPFVYISDAGWVENDKSIFYHSQLCAFSLFKDFIEVLQNNKLRVPDKELLKYYSLEPFTLNDSQVEVILQSSEYSKEGAIALIEFCKDKLNIFEKGFFIENGNALTFTTENDRLQYYTSKDEVRTYVTKYCNDSLVSLPTSLNAYKESVLRDQDLYKEIIDSSSDSWYNSESVLRDLLELLSSSGLSRIVKDFINQQAKISLVKELNDLTLSWVTLINNVYEVQEMDQIRQKVLIDGIQLSELNWNNSVVLEGEESIELGNIQQRFNDNQVVDILKAQLLKLNKFDSNKINAIFQSNSKPTLDDLARIAVDMLEVENNQIKNCDQLRLILYLNDNQKFEDLESIQVLAINDEWHPLNDHWYLKKHSFVNDNAVLHPMYVEIGRKTGDDYSILSKPYFQRDKNKFVCPHLTKDLHGKILIDFLELIKDQANKNAQVKVSWLDKLSENIGFSPAMSLLTDEKIIHTSESLPLEVVEWALSKKENAIFLEITGVHGDSSPIVLMRKYFLGDNPDYLFEGFSRTNEADQFILRNTLEWMANSEITFDESFSNTIKSITEFIGAQDDISELVFPIGVGISEGSIVCQFKKSQNTYYFNNDVKSKFKSFNKGSFSSFIKFLITTGVDVIDPDFLSDQWLINYSTILSFEEPELDFETLDEMSSPCDLPQYIQWKESDVNEISIEFINDSIPYTVSINAITGYYIEYKDGDYYFDRNKKVLYTKSQSYLKALVDVLKDFITSDDLGILLGEFTPIQYSSRETELLREISFLKDKLNNILPSDEYSRGDLSGESQKDWNLEARTLLRNHLETLPEFDCTQWDDSNIPSSIVNGVLYEGKSCIWIVRSAMSSKSQFHLTPKEWTMLGNKNVFLALRTSKENIQIYGINEDIRETIFEDNHTINFNFDSVMLTYDGMNALANTLVHYNVFGSGLVFKNPHYSAGIELMNLSKCKEGIIKKLSDELL